MASAAEAKRCPKISIVAGVTGGSRDGRARGGGSRGRRRALPARRTRRRGRVRDSAGLSAVQRRANLAGTFALAGGVPAGAVLVLVDDVVSSGATLTEAAAVLGAAMPPGDPPVLAAVVAATPRAAGGPTSARDLRVVPNRPDPGPGPPTDRLSGRGRRD